MQLMQRMCASVAVVAMLVYPPVGGRASATPGNAQAVSPVWSKEELAVLASLRLSQLAPPPHDASNAVEESPAAIALGQRLFNDPRFSGNHSVSCASCHDPNKQFQDGLPMAHGVGQGTRRAMPLAGSAYSPWLFWDGRKDSLWAQALGPLEDAVEHGGNRLRYAHLLQTHYRAEYEAVFAQAMPDLSQLPQDAGPNGTSAQRDVWNALDAQTKVQVSRIFSNMGKAIAAYEKTVGHQPTRFDRYAESVVQGEGDGASATMTPQEINGLRTFIGKGQCVTCHNGPLLTDQHFHNTGVPPRDAAHPDEGRATAIAAVLHDEFNCLGPFSDAKPEQCQELRFIATQDPAMLGAFKTPSLRGVAQRPPYMHAGQFATLRAVMQHYMQAPAAAIGHTERAPLRLSKQEAQDLVAFLGSLSQSPVENSLKN